jgi:hypothetical protein
MAYGGKPFLKQYHHHTAIKANDNHRDVMNWFKNKDDPTVNKLFFDSNLCHDWVGIHGSTMIIFRSKGIKVGNPGLCR